ncbi:MAG: DUF4365 domain-containing protein [Bacilli bacterium]|nr:DUF4365 domain-containing protein [Bacilli bacterium]
MDISTKSQEEISISYLCAVASKANALPQVNRRDEEGNDIFITKRVTTSKGKIIDSTICFQIKSVYSNSGYSIDEHSNITYKLKVKNFNDLVRPSTVEKYLALLVMPENNDNWVEQDYDKLTIRKCMYFVSLKNREPSDNIESVSVFIPKENILDSEHLLTLLREAAEDDE